MKRFSIFLKWGIAFVVLVAAFLSVIIWWLDRETMREWNQCKADLKAHGFDLDPQAYIPPPVTDERNFAMASIMRSYADYTRDPKTHEVIYTHPVEHEKLDKISVKALMGVPALSWKSWEKGQPSALTEPQAAEVLKAMQPFEGEMDEMATALLRPETRFPFHYEEGTGILFPQFKLITQFGSLYALRAMANLELGKTNDAWDDLQRTLLLSKDCHQSQLLIPFLEGMEITATMSLPVIWEGLRLHRWSDAQLALLEQELSSDQLLPGLKFGIYSDTAIMTNYVFGLRQEAAGDLLTVGSMDKKMEQILKASGSLVPLAFVIKNIVNHARLVNGYLLKEFDSGQGLVFPMRDQVFRSEIMAARKERPFSTFLSNVALPVYSSVVEMVAYFEQQRRFASFACQLERYHLKHGEYPEKVDAYTREFAASLPRDICSGSPVRYVRQNEGYRLWSIGWNLKDEAGEIAIDKSGRLNKEQGDWVWMIP
ncbi:MAG: hypothetical protein QM796_22900 [Chthoniobacteraceae bacterium]